jgi:hypothetical protein
MSHQEADATEIEGSVGVEAEECAICGDEFTENDDKFTLSCKHTYHKKCIMLEIESSKNNASRCPYCRTSIDCIPLFYNQIPIKNIHKEYTKYNNQYVPFSDFKHFLDTETRCCALVLSQYYKNNQNQDTFRIGNPTRQCNRKKMRNNEYFCYIHNKKFGDMDLSKSVYYFP